MNASKDHRHAGTSPHARRAWAQMNHNHVSEAACETTDCAAPPRSRLPLVWTVHCGWHGWRAGRSRSPVRRTRRTLFLRFKSRKAPQSRLGTDARPKIAVDREGGIAVAFSIFRDKAFNGEVFYSQSAIEENFARLEPITDNAESQRFEALAFDPEGRCSLHGLTSAIAFRFNRRAKYDGAALFFASSKDAGATYSEPRWWSTTHANAAGWVLPSIRRAVPSLSSGIFLKAALGTTRS